MTLKDLHLQHSYRTGRGDMVQGFFVPCLEQAILYRRAAGYFTSHGLALAAKGVASLVSRGGQMRLVVSPHLEPDDIAALQGAMDQPQDLLRSIASKSLADVEDALVRDRLNALAWLAAAGFLQIRLAVRVDGDGAVARGIYHQKVGIFTDADGNHVAFTDRGKTLTAMVLASRVAEKNSPLVLIVTCPFINLCKHWLREMAAFGLSPVPCIQAITDYFGGVIFEYPIARAIADGRLCQYRYHAHLVTRTDAEAEECADLTARLSRMLAGAEDNADGGLTVLVDSQRKRPAPGMGFPCFTATPCPQSQLLAHLS